MFTRLVGSNRKLRRRAMTPGALVLSSIFHGTLLTGAVYASNAPEGSGEPVELVSFMYLVEPSERRLPAEATPAWPADAAAYAPPRLVASGGFEGEVIAEFVVLTNGSIDLTTVKIISATHDGLEQATRQVLGQLRFTPGRFNGEPVPIVTRLPIAWRVGVG